MAGCSGCPARDHARVRAAQRSLAISGLKRLSILARGSRATLERAFDRLREALIHLQQLAARPERVAVTRSPASPAAARAGDASTTNTPTLVHSADLRLFGPHLLSFM